MSKITLELNDVDEIELDALAHLTQQPPQLLILKAFREYIKNAKTRSIKDLKSSGTHVTLADVSGNGTTFPENLTPEQRKAKRAELMSLRPGFGILKGKSLTVDGVAYETAAEWQKAMRSE